MNDLYLTLNFVIFQVMPYAILAILLLGSFARYLISPFSWKSQSSELIDKKDLMWGANLFHIGVIIVFFGHVFGLFTPSAILDMMGMTPAVHQLVGSLCRRHLCRCSSPWHLYSVLPPLFQ